MSTNYPRDSVLFKIIRYFLNIPEKKTRVEILFKPENSWIILRHLVSTSKTSHVLISEFPRETLRDWSINRTMNNDTCRKERIPCLSHMWPFIAEELRKFGRVRVNACNEPVYKSGHSSHSDFLSLLRRNARIVKEHCFVKADVADGRGHAGSDRVSLTVGRALKISCDWESAHVAWAFSRNCTKKNG